MKLRLRGNTVRLRLSQREVREVALGHPVTEVLEVAPGAALVYELASADGVDVLAVALDGARLVVTVPVAVARRWADSDDVGFAGTQTVRPGVTLHVLVEKDFACLKPRENEDDSDAFTNPQASK